MLNRISSKTKLLVPIFGLIAILIFFSSLIIISNYSKKHSLEELKERILFTNIISETLHSLQKERGLSSGIVSNTKEKFKKELVLQRVISDTKIKKLQLFAKEISSNIFKKELNDIFKKLQKLHYMRVQIDLLHYDSDELIKNYSALNEFLLQLIVDISKESYLPYITQNILAYSNMLYLKEYAGIERAEGIVILLTPDVTLKQYLKFSKLLVLQKQNEAIFFKYASPKVNSFYQKTLQQKLFSKVQDMEVMIGENFSTTNIDAKYWYDMMTKKLDSIKEVGKYIKDETNRNITQEINEANKIFILVATLSFIGFVVFVFMLLAFLRLAKEEQRLRLVMDKYIISSVTDTKGIITDASEAFCKISGYSKEELVGKNHNIVRHPDMPKETFKKLWYSIVRGESWSGKVKNRKKDGGFYWVYAHVEPLFDKKRRVESYISIRMDITQNELLSQKILEEERKNKLQNELMHQQYRLAQMGEMLSMIAHQWRQPLSAITAAVGVIELKAQKSTLETQMAISLSQKIKGFANHLSATIDDFRNFFKPNKTKIVTNFQKIIQSVLLIVESSLNKNNIGIYIDIENSQEFDAYENELKQVLLNLIKNAEDALIEKGINNPKIWIYEKGLTLCVRDNGGGVPEEIQEKIFEPYFSTKIKKDGTGLGLYMSKIIIEDHCKGKLDVSNDEDGAIFCIDLGGKYA